VSSAPGETIVSFPSPAVEPSSTAGAGLRTGVLIDATEDPGVALLVTFQPATPAPGGVAMVAGTQDVTAIVPIDLSALLPVFWLASVLRIGDVAANRLAYPYSSASDQFQMAFGEVVLAHQQGAWQLPNYDSNAYAVNVGFGIGTGGLVWGYRVPARPGDSVTLAAGSYQLARSDGQSGIGDPLPENLEAWTIPLGYAYALTFDACGNGLLTEVAD
jgi:hypothetical protein